MWFSGSKVFLGERETAGKDKRLMTLRTKRDKQPIDRWQNTKYTCLLEKIRWLRWEFGRNKVENSEKWNKPIKLSKIGKWTCAAQFRTILGRNSNNFCVKVAKSWLKTTKNIRILEFFENFRNSESLHVRSIENAFRRQFKSGQKLLHHLSLFLQICRKN